ncbi:MAG: hypothetical protein I8H95_04405 [Rhodocyclales bacterium]|nr:hypothetical protein [Rhodocyclales bacterium]
MDSWKFESNLGKQTALSLACIAVGTILVIGFRHFDGSSMTNSVAGFLCGLLLLLIGISAFLVSGKQTIVVDPQRRRIVVEDKNRFGIKKRSIRFSEITDTSIGYIGKRSNFVNFYYIILELKSGEKYPLFSPGRFHDGGSDKSVMESRRQRLENCIKQAVGE